MYCRNCGEKLNDDQNYCPKCGQECTEPWQQGPRYKVEPGEYQQYQAKPDPDGFAIASLILGILSFFIIPLIGAILAIVFANKSMERCGVTTVAKVGKILGIISLILCIVSVVIIVICVAVFGVGLMNAVYF